MRTLVPRLGEEAAEGDDAEDGVGAGVVAEEDRLLVLAARAVAEERVGHFFEVVDEPGAFGADVFADFQKVGGFLGVELGGRAGAEVVDISGEDAFGSEEEGFAFVCVIVELFDDARVEGEHRVVFAGLHFFEGVEDVVLDQFLLAEHVEDEEVEGGRAWRGFRGELVEGGDEVVAAVGEDAIVGGWAVMVRWRGRRWWRRGLRKGGASTRGTRCLPACFRWSRDVVLGVGEEERRWGMEGSLVKWLNG